LSYVLNLGCCIYTKPQKFGEVSSESEEDECESCFGHVEKKKKGHKKQPKPDTSNDSKGSSDKP